MKILHMVVFLLPFISGCATSIYGDKENYQSKEEIAAIKICGLGYELKNGIYRSIIEKNIYEDGKVTAHEKIELDAYIDCKFKFLEK